MFPLSFSSSSSLSSIPPSLDSVSEFERRLSDISEDDDPSADALPSSDPSPFADQHPAGPDQLVVNPPTPSRTPGVELRTGEESAAAPAYWRRVYLKCLSLALCFVLWLGKIRDRFPSGDLLSALSNRLGSLGAALQHVTSAWARKSKVLSTRVAKFSFPAPEFDAVLAALWLKWADFMAFLKAHPFTRRVASLLAPPGQNQLLASLIGSPLVSSLPSGLRSLPLRCARRVSPPLRRYLSAPSPLFLPCLLVVFLLAVMLTASQSLGLALVLATPLGLTLCCLESIVSTQRRSAVLPLTGPASEERSGSLTPPRMRHLARGGWTQEMCDPAA